MAKISQHGGASHGDQAAAVEREAPAAGAVDSEAAEGPRAEPVGEPEPAAEKPKPSLSKAGA